MVTRLLERIGSRSRDEVASQQRSIQVYRRHVARALAEERWSAAEIFLDRILDVSPANTEAWLMKGFVNQHCVRDVGRAKTCFEKVVALCGLDADHPHGQRARRSLTLLTET